MTSGAGWAGLTRKGFPMFGLVIAVIEFLTAVLKLLNEIHNFWS